MKTQIFRRGIYLTEFVLTIVLFSVCATVRGQDIYVSFEDVKFIADNRVSATVFVQNFGATRYVGVYYGQTGMSPGFEDRCEFSLSYTDLVSGRETSTHADFSNG